MQKCEILCELTSGSITLKVSSLQLFVLSMKHCLLYCKGLAQGNSSYPATAHYTLQHRTPGLLLLLLLGREGCAALSINIPLVMGSSPMFLLTKGSAGVVLSYQG